jgi:predicted SAM-dependent methyltransferase
MNKLARAGLRPFVRPLKWLTRPIITRLHLRVVHWTHEVTDTRFAGLDRQAASLRTDVDGMIRYVPIILNSIQTQNAMSRANARTYDELTQLIATVLERSQTLRDETLAEVRRPGSQSTRSLVEAKILNQDKVDAAGLDIRLDLGADHRSRREHLHVDQHALDDVDVVAGAMDLPFAPGSVKEIVSEHLLESFSSDELARDILPHWFSRLVPGGDLVAVVTDIDAALKEHVAGRISLEDLRRLAFGAPESSSRAIHTAESLSQLFAGAGFDEITVRACEDASAVQVIGHKPRVPPGA